MNDTQAPKTVRMGIMPSCDCCGEVAVWVHDPNPDWDGNGDPPPRTFLCAEHGSSHSDLLPVAYDWEHSPTILLLRVGRKEGRLERNEELLRSILGVRQYEIDLCKSKIAFTNVRVHGPGSIGDTAADTAELSGRSRHAPDDVCGIVTDSGAGERWCAQPPGHGGPHKLA